MITNPCGHQGLVWKKNGIRECSVCHADLGRYMPAPPLTLVEDKPAEGEPQVWTVAQLRAALEGVPDDTRVRVAYALDSAPDETPTYDEQIVTAAAQDAAVWYRDTQQHEPPRTTADGWFTIETDFPPADYRKGPT